ncbi:hypothetical protein [Nocardia aurantia]|uniref:Uncharacterized protein n=1 Tax=Nocardia aurantia TaxID=2585199 RepID=A0A7K0DQU9_9NOCA|nr:hypothetical protein [Nocardia aurantia]MQY27742.1 hypothetical protein [Nocardia aurantia]
MCNDRSSGGVLCICGGAFAIGVPADYSEQWGEGVKKMILGFLGTLLAALLALIGL